MNFRNLLREPALLLDVAETLLVALVAFGLPLSGDQQTYIVAALIAVVGAVKAFTVQPWAVPAITDAGRAILVVVASFGVGLDANQIAVAATLLGSVLTLIARAQITPGNSPVVAVGGAGAGPVGGAHLRNEAGYTNVLYALGIGLIVLSVLLLVLLLLKVFLVSPIVLVLLFVVGLVLLFLGGRGTRTL